MIIDKKEHQQMLISILENQEIKTKGKEFFQVAQKFNEVLEAVKNAVIVDSEVTNGKKDNLKKLINKE